MLRSTRAPADLDEPWCESAKLMYRMVAAYPPTLDEFVSTNLPMVWFDCGVEAPVGVSEAHAAVSLVAYTVMVLPKTATSGELPKLRLTPVMLAADEAP